MKTEKKSIYTAPILCIEAAFAEAGFASSGSDSYGDANEAGDTVRENGDYTYSL